MQIWDALVSRLQPMTGERFADDVATAATVQTWLDRGFAGFCPEGVESTETVMWMGNATPDDAVLSA